MSSLGINPFATSLSLYLMASLVSFHFWVKIHLNASGWILGGVGITSVNTSLLFSEPSFALVASFHLI
jgi:hypothetical protein